MTAPPWLKPPSTIFSAGMPAETSPSIICGAHAINAERAEAPHGQLSSATTEVGMTSHLLNPSTGLLEAPLVLWAAIIQRGDVKPTGHRVAAVERDWPGHGSPNRCESVNCTVTQPEEAFFLRSHLTGAVGKMNLVFGKRLWGMPPSQPSPVSPVSPMTPPSAV